MAKKIIKESELRKIIFECIKKGLNEEGFRQVDDLPGYVQQQNLQMRQASKFQQINARPARPGEIVVTIASDGVTETTNQAEQGDWVVNNVGNPNNQWIIKGDVFQKKYQPVPGQEGVYMPKGGPMNAAQISEPISFRAPWGEQMNIDKGGYILSDPNNPNDMYGISQKDFDSTYRFNETPMNESKIRNIVSRCIKEALEEIGPDAYQGYADKAASQTKGVRGAMNKVFRPGKFKKFKRQADAFKDMAKDHPDDVWDTIKTGDAYQGGEGYRVKNRRTGEERGYQDWQKRPFRGKKA